MSHKLVRECANRDRLKTDKNVFPAHAGKKYFNKNKEEVSQGGISLESFACGYEQGHSGATASATALHQCGQLWRARGGSLISRIITQTSAQLPRPGKPRSTKDNDCRCRASHNLI